MSHPQKSGDGNQSAISRQSVGDQAGHAAIEGAPELSESGSDRGQSVGNQAAIRRQSGARQRSLRVDPLFAERNIIKPFRQQFGVERTGLLPEEAGGLWQRIPAGQ